MKNITFKKKASVIAIGLLFSVSVFAGGGDSGGDDNSGDLPSPNTCTSNCGFQLGPNPSLSFVQAGSGPLPTSSTNVASSVDGFGGNNLLSYKRF